MVFTARPSGRAVSFLIAVYFASGASVYHKAPGLSSGRKYRLKQALFRLVRNIFSFRPIRNSVTRLTSLCALCDFFSLRRKAK